MADIGDGAPSAFARHPAQSRPEARVTLEVLLIAVVRIIGSLPVLRWAFAGAVIAILVDLSDLFIMNLVTLGGVPNYQVMDKWLDQVYLALFLLVALRWSGPVRTIAITLYALRLAGFVAFKAIGERWVLFLFPNVFEFWFLYVAAALHWRPALLTGGARPLVIALGLLTAAKLAHEYTIHVAKALDHCTAVEAVETIWRWLTFW
ncbi:MAG: hypothetical protein DWG78_02375 [Chloroflexi bacterium]|nr:hypothetical protein [Chloroflexota bacterium]